MADEASQRNQEAPAPQAEDDRAQISELTDENIIQRARSDIEEAQRYVQQAYELFNKGKSTIPSQFKEAKLLLEKANRSIRHLRTLLDETLHLPEPIVSRHVSINSQINIVNDQVENHLLPSLDKQFLGNFTPLLNALKQIDALIPKME